MDNWNAKSPNETADELELQGAELILFDDGYIDGSNCWKKSIEVRSGPRRVVPEENLPPVTRQFAGPQWTNSGDIDEIVRGIDNFDGLLRAVYQAMFVRLAHGRDLEKLLVMMKAWYYARFPSLDASPAVTSSIVKFTLVQFEWEALYGYCYPAHFYDWVHMVSSRFDNVSHLASFENMMAIVKWLATAFEKHRAQLEAKGLLEKRQSIAVKPLMVDELDVSKSIVSLLTRLYAMPLDDAQICEFKKCISRIIAVEWCDTSGKDLLMWACIAWHQQGPHSSKLIRLLVELGADVNTIDDNGNTCLLYLVNSTQSELKNPAIVQFLLANGADPDVPNKQGLTAREFFHSCKVYFTDDPSTIKHILDNGPNLDIVNLLSKAEVWAVKERTGISFPFPSLQKICAKTLKRDANLSDLNLPKHILRFVEKS